MQNELYQRRFISSHNYVVPHHQTFVAALEQFTSRIAHKAADFFRKWQEQRTNRLAFQHMLTLDDHLLSDIGVTRDDVIRVNNMPLSVNAARELEKIARQSK